jgi:hypothetical protein
MFAPPVCHDNPEKPMQAERLKPIDVRILLLLIPVAYVSYLFHEFGHWSIGEALGNRMVYSMNYVWPRDGHYVQESHGLFVSAGGPAFTLLQAFLALLIIEKFRTPYAYPFAFFPMFNRFFSLLLGGFSKQDEARIALLMGTGTYVVAIIVLGLLLAIVFRCSHTLKLGFRPNAYMFTASTICQLLVIGTYEFVKL